MSLNGLDSTILKEAYDAAVAEPGGWYVVPSPLASLCHSSSVVKSLN